MDRSFFAVAVVGGFLWTGSIIGLTQVMASTTSPTPSPSPTPECLSWQAPPYYGTLCGPPGDLTIQSPSPIPTPTLGPTASPTPTSTASPTPPPVSTPSPQPTASAITYVTGDKTVKAVIAISPTSGAVSVTFTKTSTTPASVILTNRLAFSSVSLCNPACVALPDSSPVYFSMSVSPTIVQFGAPAK